MPPHGNNHHNRSFDIRLGDTRLTLQRKAQWWRSAVVYEIAPISFQDTNGDGKISKGDVAWLRGALFSGEEIRDEDRKFLHELKGEAKETGPEFEALFKESMKEPQEPHTAGHG